MSNLWTSPRLDRAKAQLGATPAIVWLIGGAILFVREGGLRRLLALDAIAFLLIGMFVAAAIVGSVMFFIIVRMAKHHAKKYGDPLVSQKSQAVMEFWRPILRLLNFVLSIVFLLWVYDSLYWSRPEH